MRSSPNFLVESRRGPETLDFTGYKPLKGGPMDVSPEFPRPEDGHEDEGMTLYLKVNYKVILAVIVIADIFHVSLAEFVYRVFN